jgi:cytoskeletal protein RodZ
MKKVLFALAIAATFVACEEKKTDATTPEVKVEGTTGVDAEKAKADSTAKADSIAKAAMAPKTTGTEVKVDPKTTEVKVETPAGDVKVDPKNMEVKTPAGDVKAPVDAKKN